MKRFRTWIKESAGSEWHSISLKREMAEVPRPMSPKPAGWKGPFPAKFDKRGEGGFRKGDMIYWNGKSGAEARNMPAFSPENIVPNVVSPNVAKTVGVQSPVKPNVSNTVINKNSEVNPSGEIIFNFSKKHLGKSMSWVAQNDPGFIKWMLEKRISDKQLPHAMRFIDDKGNQVNVTPQMLMQSIGVGDDDGDDDVENSLDKHKNSKKPSTQEVRIPPEHMTEFNKNIENKFVGSGENIMIDALAGTGKTTMLKHLSSYIKPGEKWLYVVFGKKNQLESENAFPKGVEVMTTHKFLGQVLKGVNRQIGGGTKLTPRTWGKETKLSKISDNDQITPLSWPESSQSSNIEKKIYRDNKDTGQTQRVLKSPWNWNARNCATEVTRLAKAVGLNPNDPNIEQQITELVQNFAINTDVASPNSKRQPERDFTPDIIKKAIEFLQLSQPQALDQISPHLSSYRDQDDTLWYAAIHADEINWKLGYDVILMDEVQDFNMCQIIMAQKLREAGARVIAVGDPNQGMYLFRGADSKAFSKLSESLGVTGNDSLPINFRSGGNIIDWVRNNTHVKNLQSAPHLEGQGEVWAEGGTHPPVGYEDFMFKLMDEWGKNGKTDMDTVFIARNNAPLAHAALTLLKNNIDFEIVGVDLSKDLVKLIKSITWNKPQNVSIAQFKESMHEYSENCRKLWGNRISKKGELKEVRSYIGVLDSVYDHLAEKGFRDTEEGKPMETALDLINFLNEKLGGVDPDNVDNEKNVQKMKEMEEKKKNVPGSFITLTTAHKSKGLEYDRAFLMKPGQYNPEDERNQTEGQKQQEMNAWYVAATRAKKVLMVSSDEEPDAKSTDDENALHSDPEQAIRKMRMF
jgi:superfamily I DNA/RNA helicase